MSQSFLCWMLGVCCKETLLQHDECSGNRLDRIHGEDDQDDASPLLKGQDIEEGAPVVPAAVSSDDDDGEEEGKPTDVEIENTDKKQQQLIFYGWDRGT